MVLDASALLAYLQDEPGADTVEGALEDGATIGTANWSEVAQKVGHRGDWDVARALLLSYGLVLAPVTSEDAELAARLWRAGRDLSLADRLCIALGDRLGATVLTADRACDRFDHVQPIR